MRRATFCVFDTETTGLSASGGDRIIEIAALKFSEDRTVGAFRSFVNPHRCVSPGAYYVNRISDAMLTDAPEARDVLREFRAFISGAACLCAYNAPFDIAFLRNELKLAGLPALRNVQTADILTMARMLLPGLERYSLACVSQTLRLAGRQKHRALDDVELTVRLFRHLCVRMEEEGKSDLKSLLSLCGCASGDPAEARTETQRIGRAGGVVWADTVSGARQP